MKAHDLRDAVIDAAIDWQRLVDDLDAPAAQIRPALQRLDLAVTNLRRATGDASSSPSTSGEVR